MSDEHKERKLGGEAWTPHRLVPLAYQSRREHQASAKGSREREKIFALAWFKCFQQTFHLLLEVLSGCFGLADSFLGKNC